MNMIKISKRSSSLYDRRAIGRDVDYVGRIVISFTHLIIDLLMLDCVDIGVCLSIRQYTI